MQTVQSEMPGKTSNLNLHVYTMVQHLSTCICKKGLTAKKLVSPVIMQVNLNMKP